MEMMQDILWGVLGFLKLIADAFNEMDHAASRWHPVFGPILFTVFLGLLMLQFSFAFDGIREGVTWLARCVMAFVRWCRQGEVQRDLFDCLAIFATVAAFLKVGDWMLGSRWQFHVALGGAVLAAGLALRLRDRRA
jgi:hypothetical protein